MGDDPGCACANGKEKSPSRAHSQWGFDQPFGSSRSPRYPDRAVPDAPAASEHAISATFARRSLAATLQSRLCNIGRRFGGLALESHARQSGRAARPLSSRASELSISVRTASACERIRIARDRPSPAPRRPSCREFPQPSCIGCIAPGDRIRPRHF
jgi:hypothetical protein